MNCREFRRKHDEYLDDTLSAVEMDAVSAHLRGCARCARQDTRVRRGLVLARNLPRIAPSPAFGARLQERLTHEHDSRASAGSYLQAGPRGTMGRRLASGTTAIAAGMLAAAALTYGVMRRAPDPIRMDPVVATRSEVEPSLATPAMVASMSTGMVVWPAVYVAQQAPWHFASDAVGR